MLKTIVNKSATPDVSGAQRIHKESAISGFFENSPTAFAIFNQKKQELSSWNEALLNLLQCEPFMLRDSFPNPTLLRIKDRDFTKKWNHQLSILEKRGTTTFECIKESMYGGNRILLIEMWQLSAGEQSDIAIKIEDVTKNKKLAWESTKYTRII